MMEYGQLCPLAKATEVLGERWTFLVIRELLSGATRFNEIRRGVPLMSPSLLSQRLQRLEREGILCREASGSGSGHLYRLTAAGEELAPVIRRLSRWGERWVLGHVDLRALDVTALLWAVRRRVDPAVFGEGRTTVEFAFTDQPNAKRHWWLVNEGGNVDLCPKDPGFPIDLYVTTDLATMARIWVGALSLSAALDSGRLDLTGPRALRHAFKSWLLLSPFARKAAAEPRMSGLDRHEARNQGGL